MGPRNVLKTEYDALKFVENEVGPRKYGTSNFNPEWITDGELKPQYTLLSFCEFPNLSFRYFLFSKNRFFLNFSNFKFS